jgi:hypothetical protein
LAKEKRWAKRRLPPTRMESAMAKETSDVLGSLLKSWIMSQYALDRRNVKCPYSWGAIVWLRLLFFGKNLNAFKVQRVIHPLHGKSFFIWIKHPEIGQQIDMTHCNILDV